MEILDSAPGVYVQIPELELAGIQLEHLTSAIDMSISLPQGDLSSDTLTGYTEWVAKWQTRQLSIGWDWAFSNETVILIHADEIRSNVLLIGENGAPRSPGMTRRRLVEWVETLPWREGAVRALIQRNRRPAR